MLWTIDRFREEVEQVRVALGLEDFFLYGQSWGSMLAIEYALKYQKHLKGLVLSSMTASIASYVEYVNKLRAALPPRICSRRSRSTRRQGKYDAPEYQEAMFKEVYGRHVCRVDPWPDPVARAFKHINTQVYNTMQGPNEFVVTGTFKDWDRWKDLAKITVPTLVIGARYDEMNPDDIRKMGTPSSEFPGRDLRERQPPGDVGRPGGLLRGPPGFPQRRRGRTLPAPRSA